MKQHTSLRYITIQDTLLCMGDPFRTTVLLFLST
jgi:hypothetical protein